MRDIRPAHPCRTVRCPREATATITVTYRDGEAHTDEVCAGCARYYVTYSGTDLLDNATVETVEV